VPYQFLVALQSLVALMAIQAFVTQLVPPIAHL
jgi:hypothetical protein